MKNILLIYTATPSFVSVVHNNVILHAILPRCYTITCKTLRTSNALLSTVLPLNALTCFIRSVNGMFDVGTCNLNVRYQMLGIVDIYVNVIRGFLSAGVVCRGILK